MDHLKSKNLLISLFVLAGLISIIMPVRKSMAAPQSINSELLARVITAEAEAEPYSGQVAVGAVILNRIQSPKFPNTLAGVVYQPHAFESVSNGQINKPATQSCIKAARDAMSGWDPSGGALFFYNPSKVTSPTSYVWSRKTIQQIGKHVFAL